VQIIMTLSARVRGQLIHQVALEKGIDEEQVALPPCYFATLLLDLLLGQFIICPLITCCWRSGWLLGDYLIDSLLLPGKPNLGILLSVGLGTTITGLLRCVNFAPGLPTSLPSVPHVLISRTFTIVYFCTYMLVWRGWWGLLTFLQLPDVVLLIISLGLLLLSGCLGTNIGAPLAISRDSRQEAATSPFRSSKLPRRAALPQLAEECCSAYQPVPSLRFPPYVAGFQAGCLSTTYLLCSQKSCMWTLSCRWLLVLLRL